MIQNYSNISTLADCEALQYDLNKLAVWSKTWLLNFDATKCVVLKIRLFYHVNVPLMGGHLVNVDRIFWLYVPAKVDSNN